MGAIAQAEPKVKSSFGRTLLLLTLLLVSGASCRADEEEDWLTSIKHASPDPTSSTAGTEDATGSHAPSKIGTNEYGTLDTTNFASMRSHASAHLKAGHVDTAIKLVEQALEMRPDDTDCRQIYADALEAKVRSQVERDPHTFNLCVKQWYFLYKNAEYPEIGTTAATHLKELTGKSPYVWPTPKLFLSRVLMPELPGTSSTPLASEEPVQVH